MLIPNKYSFKIINLTPLENKIFSLLRKGRIASIYSMKGNKSDPRLTELKNLINSYEGVFKSYFWEKYDDLWIIKKETAGYGCGYLR